MTEVTVDTPTGKCYTITVEKNICFKLINVFEEIEDMACQAWIFNELNHRITKSDPHLIGSYLGYTWRKKYDMRFST